MDLTDILLVVALTQCSLSHAEKKRQRELQRHAIQQRPTVAPAPSLDELRRCTRKRQQAQAARESRGWLGNVLRMFMFLFLGLTVLCLLAGRFDAMGTSFCLALMCRAPDILMRLFRAGQERWQQSRPAPSKGARRLLLAEELWPEQGPAKTHPGENPTAQLREQIMIQRQAQQYQ